MNKPFKFSLLGSGWLGLPLASVLKQRGHQVTLSATTDKKVQSLQQSGFDACQLNIDSLDTTKSEFFICDVLIVTITSKSLKGFQSLTDRIQKHKIEQVIFTSSTSVYPLINDWVDEQTPTNDSPLAQIEKLFLSEVPNVVTILRLAGLCGYDRQPGRFFRKKKVIPNPQGFINLVHRDDVIAAILAVIDKDCWGQVLNVCADEHPTRKDFYTQQILNMGMPLPEFGSDESNCWKKVSNEKIKKLLDIEFQSV